MLYLSLHSFIVFVCLLLFLPVNHDNNCLPLFHFCSYYTTSVYTEAAVNKCEDSLQRLIKHHGSHHFSMTKYWEGWPTQNIITTVPKENYYECSFHLMWVYTNQMSLHKNNLFLDFLNPHQTTEWPLFSLEQTDCVRLHQQKYILRVRLDRRAP